ncbi:uncharacterized protein ASCRUDRAFT_127798 [Ascoidea rubescens DSM 1968]|uniref:Uncharacterized protein n=1 Tax=Ascoidea rubescens DSM 1968 TaxID=1344418 RepID=A0A1D2VNK6_9ASCO|nr:hypothetical protein ASCRUDRAFT_127798 [Ascoidea rubescens DSM 1968]ODV63179.1 hypothetical protein ASCRUDRAFT_127798 [Ascoidea rubescens DSM 1968]
MLSETEQCWGFQIGAAKEPAMIGWRGLAGEQVQSRSRSGMCWRFGGRLCSSFLTGSRKGPGNGNGNGRGKPSPRCAGVAVNLR